MKCTGKNEQVAKNKLKRNGKKSGKERESKMTAKNERKFRVRRRPLLPQSTCRPNTKKNSAEHTKPRTQCQLALPIYNCRLLFAILSFLVLNYA